MKRLLYAENDEIFCAIYTESLFVALLYCRRNNFFHVKVAVSRCVNVVHYLYKFESQKKSHRVRERRGGVQCAIYCFLSFIIYLSAILAGLMLSMNRVLRAPRSASDTLIPKSVPGGLSISNSSGPLALFTVSITY